jgi:hypothetical protein
LGEVVSFIKMADPPSQTPLSLSLLIGLFLGPALASSLRFLFSRRKSTLPTNSFLILYNIYILVDGISSLPRRRFQGRAPSRVISHLVKNVNAIRPFLSNFTRELKLETHLLSKIAEVIRGLMETKTDN